MTIEIEVADAGLDEARLVPLVDVEDPVHALQVEDDAARIRQVQIRRYVRFLPVEIG